MSEPAQKEKPRFVRPTVTPKPEEYDSSGGELVMNTYDFGENYEKKVCCRHCNKAVGEPHGRDCAFTRRAAWHFRVPPTDLRDITRHAELSNALIQVGYESYSVHHTWLRCGLLNVNTNERMPGQVELRSYLGRGATDFEHDSAYAFCFKVIGWQFVSIDRYSIVEFTGWIVPRGEAEDFRVPNPGYNPFEGQYQGADGRGEDIYMCSGEQGECKWADGKEHAVVDYLPPANPELYEKLKGLPIRVTISPTFPKED
jgi:hypothetical protein